MFGGIFEQEDMHALEENLICKKDKDTSMVGYTLDGRRLTSFRGSKTSGCIIKLSEYIQSDEREARSAPQDDKKVNLWSGNFLACYILTVTMSLGFD